MSAAASIWQRYDQRPILRMSGSLGSQPAVPIFAIAEMDGLPAVKLAFACIKQSGVPLILGQTNFFMESDACFYRSVLEFEIRPKAPA